MSHKLLTVRIPLGLFSFHILKHVLFPAACATSLHEPRRGSLRIHSDVRGDPQLAQLSFSIVTPVCLALPRRSGRFDLNRSEFETSKAVSQLFANPRSYGNIVTEPRPAKVADGVGAALPF